ncbi:hypothetical protein K438DRAFT_1751151 [Mycena galopus ATCC 62051]|nr:hypothetical protein K438DRAFT_1751151 [Mycena galopus ATCC 62051]
MDADTNPMLCNAHGNRFVSSTFLPSPSDIVHLHPILRSIPMEASTRSFHGTISAAAAEVLLRYDEEIESPKAVLAQPTADRVSLASYTDGCRSGFSPIRRLPAEFVGRDLRRLQRNRKRIALLNDIYSNCLRYPFVGTKSSCATPLWSTNTSDPFCGRTSTIRGHTLNFRSSTLAVSPDDEELETAGDVAFDLLHQHAPRWRDVYFRAERPLSRSLTASLGCLAYLQKLRLEGNWRKTELCRAASRLTEVIFHGPPTQNARAPVETDPEIHLHGQNAQRFSALAETPQLPPSAYHGFGLPRISWPSASVLPSTTISCPSTSAQSSRKTNIRCLAALSLLEPLSVGEMNTDPPHILVRDNLLQTLSWKADEPSSSQDSSS